MGLSLNWLACCQGHGVQQQHNICSFQALKHNRLWKHPAHTASLTPQYPVPCVSDHTTQHTIHGITLWTPPCLLPGPLPYQVPCEWDSPNDGTGSMGSPCGQPHLSCPSPLPYQVPCKSWHKMNVIILPSPSASPPPPISGSLRLKLTPAVGNSIVQTTVLMILLQLITLPSPMYETCLHPLPHHANFRSTAIRRPVFNKITAL
jgi:hypothetical protein